jgi:predicted dienelactone hydrolase
VNPAASATVRWLATILVAGTLAALTATHARAGTGLMELPATGSDGPVTLFYPTDADNQTVRRGPFTFALAPDAAPKRGNGRLVMVSHGSGGAPWVHVDLARALVDAGFIVAMPEHRGDSYKDFSEPGPETWKRRPAEVSRAIDAVARHALFAPLLSTDRVGLFGGSAGGHTALSFAGGRWSPARLRQHCEQHIEEDFSSCAGYTTRLRGNWLDGIKKLIVRGVLRERFDDPTWYNHDDPRVKAAIAAVPYAADFDMTTLARPPIALGLITAGKDINQIPHFHSDAVLAACQRCEVVAASPDASHGVMLSPAPPDAVQSAIAMELNGDPPGFDRPAAVALMNRNTVEFFRKHLLP